ncbi:DUF4384 domain-containing protein [Roseofilum reptotaenium]|uniref:DUF4384 domain-containing protein n=1 Tax=Roseofilum reptotaenium TaxID=1233427 RepID=UPI00232C456A|nr:DUF4384 domain-containing protein [Roseofilum reptotaenium]
MTDVLESKMEHLGVKVMQPVDIPERYERLFLESRARQLGLSGITLDVFKTRLCKDNLNKQWCELTEELPGSINGDNARKNVWGKEISKALKEAGFNAQENGKKLWLDVHKWLEQKYEPWLWEMLTQKLERAQDMGFLETGTHEPKVADLGRYRPSEPYVKRVKGESQLILEIRVRQPAHLTLLLREANQEVWCLCPSEYIPNSKLETGKHIFPQPCSHNEDFHVFGISDVVGKEQWLALLTLEAPRFGWLQNTEDVSENQLEPSEYQLEPMDLQEVLDYVSQGKNRRLLYTEYEVY